MSRTFRRRHDTPAGWCVRDGGEISGDGHPNKRERRAHQWALFDSINDGAGNRFTRYRWLLAQEKHPPAWLHVRHRRHRCGLDAGPTYLMPGWRRECARAVRAAERRVAHRVLAGDVEALWPKRGEGRDDRWHYD